MSTPSAPLRAALYARYSSDNQRRTSIEDQHRNARAIAAELGAPVADGCEYADAEISGGMPLERRPGSRALLEAAAAGRFTVLIVEALDRFSRDLVDQERMVRRLEHRGIRIIGFTDGYDSLTEGREMLRGIRGVVNQQYLADVAKKTHRGLSGQVSRGFHAGGLSYGYRSAVAGLDAKGEPIGHRLEVDADAAERVRWIFAEYAAGQSCQSIVARLNAQRVPGPRGGSWCVSALYGSPNKGSGILNNELYVGRYVWNRSAWTKDPDTGRRQRVDRPREEWQVHERPELRIIDDATWAQVRARIGRNRLAGGSAGRGARPRTLFGGLLRCAECGGAVVAINARLYGCVARKDRGTAICAGLTVPRDQTDRRLLAAVREALLAPEALAELQATVRALSGERLRDRARQLQTGARRLGELDREITRLVDAVATVGLSPALQARLQAAEAEREALQAQIGPGGQRQDPAARQAALDRILGRYKALLLDLKSALETDGPRARQALQEVLGEVRLVRETSGEVYAEMDTRQEKLLLAAGGGDESLKVVAGARFSSQLHRIRLL